MTESEKAELRVILEQMRQSIDETYMGISGWSSPSLQRKIQKLKNDIEKAFR